MVKNKIKAVTSFFLVILLFLNSYLSAVGLPNSNTVPRVNYLLYASLALSFIIGIELVFNSPCQRLIVFISNIPVNLQNYYKTTLANYTQKREPVSDRLYHQLITATSNILITGLCSGVLACLIVYVLIYAKRKKEKQKR